MILSDIEWIGGYGVWCVFGSKSPWFTSRGRKIVTTNLRISLGSVFDF